MKRIVLSIAVLGLMLTESRACDKCRQSQSVVVATGFSAPVALAPTSLPPVQYVYPQFGVASSGVAVSTAPVYSTMAFSPVVMTVSPTAALTPAQTVQFVSTNDLQTQSLLGSFLVDLGGGVVRSIGCDVCRRAGCCGDTPAKAPSTDVLEQLKLILELFKEFKKTASAENTAEHAEQMAEIRQIRNEIQPYLLSSRSTRVAQEAR